MFSYSRIKIHSFWHCGDKGCSLYFASLIITPSFWLDHDCSTPPPPSPTLQDHQQPSNQPSLSCRPLGRGCAQREREGERGWGGEEIPFSSSRSCLLHPSEPPQAAESRLQTQLQCQEGIKTMVTNLKVNTQTTKTHTHTNVCWDHSHVL